MSKKIFISHASADKDLVKSFVNLLSSGANISNSNMFCSSIPGMGIPKGKNFIDYIRNELDSNDVIIPLISKNYLNSQVCLCELGAAWVKATNNLPIIIPPCTFKDIDGVIHGIEGTKIDDKDDLNDFINSLNDIIKNTDFNFSIWDVRKDIFLEEADQVIPNLPSPKVYSEKEYSGIKKELEESKSAIKNFLIETAKQNKIIEELKKAKDKNEYDEIINSNLPETEQFENIINETKKILNKNDTVVNYALYLNVSSGKEIYIRNYYEQKELADEAKEAAENKFLNNDDSVFTLNDEDFQVKQSIRQINSLEKFIEEKLSDNLYEAFEKEYKFKPDITNKRFWTEVLNLSIDRY